MDRPDLLAMWGSRPLKWEGHPGSQGTKHRTELSGSGSLPGLSPAGYNKLSAGRCGAWLGQPLRMLSPPVLWILAPSLFPMFIPSTSQTPSVVRSEVLTRELLVLRVHAKGPI